ncbi:MAG: hypothetical protein RMJ36_03810 [Candidatus Calescibacterium sp.]|nr:hypothetical protein [Candidatus Calescibacterium sp.]MDW8132763.1 hypothetical protein [Candidatus Calescibacterium sp.]
MELYLKIGNQNIFFIFAKEDKIIENFIIPSYITLNRENNIVKIGPYSFLQYIVIKQLQKIPEYPEKLYNRSKKYDFLVKRLVENNIIQSYKEFFNIMQYIFSYNLEKIYDLSLYEDYEKYNIPFFLDIKSLYYLLKNTSIIKWINFIEEGSPYLKNQQNFLADTIKYWKYKFEMINFWEFFHKFSPKLLNIYIAEVNAVIWVFNRYGFLKFKKVNIGLRKIKEMLSKELLKKNIFLKHTEIEKYSIEILQDNIKDNLETTKNTQVNLKNSIANFITQLPPTIIEDIYNEIQKKDINSINSFNSVTLKNHQISKMILSTFNQILIVE